MNNKAFEEAVKKAYPLHYFMLDDHRIKILRILYDSGLEAGQRQGMERSIVIMRKELMELFAVPVTNQTVADAHFADDVENAIRKEIKP